MRWNVLFVVATLLVATSSPSVAQIRVDMKFGSLVAAGSDTVQKIGILSAFG